MASSKLIEEITIGCLQIGSYDTGKARAKILKRRNWQAMAAKTRDRLQAHPSQSDENQREWWFGSLAELKQYISQDDPLLASAQQARTRIIKREVRKKTDWELAAEIQTASDLAFARSDAASRLLASVKIAEAVLDEFLAKNKPLETWEQAFKLMVLSQQSEQLAMEAIERSLNLERTVAIGAIPIESRKDGLE